MTKKLIVSAALILGFSGCVNNPATPDHTEASQAAPVSRMPSAAFKYMEVGDTLTVSCGPRTGSVSLFRESDGLLHLIVRNIGCASYTSKKLNFEVQRLDGSAATGFGKDLIVDENLPGLHEVIVGSKNFISKQTSFDSFTGNSEGAAIRFHVKAKPVTIDLTTDSRTGRFDLNRCGGTVHGTLGKDGKVYITFNGVTNCDMFDILDNNDFPSYYSSRFIENGKAIVIPSSLIIPGSNRLALRIFRNYYEGDEEMIYVNVNGSYF